ncbi:helix-turn-helix transcriptional regulator [Actinocrispum wychmicini]|uniref:Regulatory LuxR family protein n=1 Tax=Actinocrispum wychmicini TaxID=1213861 RepID=A0A4R2K7Z5_9PSEU|nr:AAA family ATPase [Actinocrispum wychmicini]TCO62485.1 regulatory LuxR family protein [Actinocrispum wychmicini]
MTLAGRAAEVATIEAALTRVGGMPWVLEVRGEPGIGKTRLIDELRERARAQGLLVLAGQSTEQGRSTAFSSLNEALSGHVVPEDLSRAQREALKVVCPTGGPGADVETYRVQRAIRALLQTLAKPSGLVLVLEDLHWADDPTVGLVTHLLRHPPAAPILLVLSYRLAQVPARVTAAIDRAVAAGEVERLEPAPLSVAAFAELLGPSASRSRVAALHRDSGGNPFYLRLLTEDGANELVDEITALPPVSRHVARTAAVAGEEFDPGLVAAVMADVSTRDTLAALDDLLARDLIQVDADDRRLRFRHPLVRAAAYQDGDDEWRANAHHRVAAELAERDAPVVVRAQHIALSAKQGDVDAVDTLLRAATALMPEDPATAAGWLRAALRLLPPGDSPLRLRVLTAAGHALAITGDLTESRALLRTAMADIPSDDVDTRIATTVQYATVTRLLGRYADARAALDRELATLPPDADTSRLKLELVLVEVVRAGEVSKDMDLIDDVLAAAREAQDPLLEACAHTAAAWAGYTAGDLDRTAASCDAAKALLDGLPDGEIAGWVEPMLWLSQAERFLDRFDDALRHDDRGIALARATGRNYVLTSLLSHRALVLRWLGRLGEAAQSAQDGVEVAERINSQARRGVALQTWSRVRLVAGAPADAVRLARMAVAAAGAEPDWWQRNARKSLLLAETEVDRVDRMAEVLDVLGGPELATIVPVNRPLDYVELVAADLAVGNVDRAADWAERAERFADPKLPSRTGLAHLAWALVLFARGDPAGAWARSRSAVADFDQRGNQFDAGRAHLVWGLATAAIGNTSGAIVHLEQASALFTESEAPSLAARATRELRQLGRRAAGTDTLTARELEIADLVAGGATNKQIAAKLVISERTVGTHLSRIYAKLGVSSRAALAAKRTRVEG